MIAQCRTAAESGPYLNPSFAERLDLSPVGQNRRNVRRPTGAAAPTSGLGRRESGKYRSRHVGIAPKAAAWVLVGAKHLSYLCPENRPEHFPGPSALSTVLDARWKSGSWELSAKTGWSSSRYQYQDTEHGFFSSTTVAAVTGLVGVPETGVGFGTAHPISLTMDFEHDYWGPKKITAWTTATGTASTNLADYSREIDWGSHDVARIGGARSRPGSSKEILSTAKLFARRHFAFSNPVSLQLGLDLTERFRNRRYDYLGWRFVGADGIPNSTDDTTRHLAADRLPRRPDFEYGYPGTERISLSKLYGVFQKNPSWFQFDEARSARLSLTSNAAYDLTETVTAPYAQFDARLLRNRVRLTGGVRYERSAATARGLLTNNSAAYMKYADGSSVRLGDRGANGALLVVNRGTATAVNYQLVDGSVLPAVRAGVPVFTPAIQAAGNADNAAGRSTDTGTAVGRASLAFTQAVYRAKGATNRGEHADYFPSLHTSYNFTENLVFQLGYAKTQGAINFQNAIIPNTAITDDLITTGTAAGALGRVTVQNPDLKPWTADNYEGRLSFYNRSGGVFGIGFFRKNVVNFQPVFDSGPMSAEEVAAAAVLYPDAEIGPEHTGYSLRTRMNSGSARLEGAELEMRQSLSALLPAWGRGITVSATASYLNRKGANGEELGLNRAWTDSANIHYRGRKISARVGYRMNGFQIENPLITSNGLTGRQIREAQHLIDFNFEYSISKWARLFVSGQNLLNGQRVTEQRFAERPGYASLLTANTLGHSFTVGVTGEFSDLSFRWP